MSAERRLHIGIAEQGKIYALAGNHQAALQHYREAMGRAVKAGEPEIFFRHYMECALESLELMGALDEVLTYCDRALAHYQAQPPANPVALRDLAHIHQRRGVMLLKLGQRAEARAALLEADRLQPGSMPLATTLIKWIDGNLHFDSARIVAEQRRHHFFSVRAENVDRSRAVALPAKSSASSIL